MPDLATLMARWPMLGGLLDEALEMPAAQRPAWVAARTDLPDALRALLAELLARGDAAPADALALPVHAAVLDRAALQPGAEVGTYRILRLLGQGGMGAVWLAERSDGQLRRKVALKLPHMVWTPGLALRLQRERDILADLQHPHIARLLDAGVDDLGRPFLALESVEGEPIDVWCLQRAAPLRQRLELLRQVADAVAHAHSRGVLHRDLKPANLLVTADAQVRLLDFGIAKLMQDGQAAATALTHDAGRVLTPEYASPEQIRGDTLAATSDIYSLGVVAFELLAGVRPLRPNAAAAGAAGAAPSGAGPLASECAVDLARRRALRGDLDAILDKALQPQPQQRYATADDFAQDLQRHLRGEPVLARPASPLQRALRGLQRYRKHATAVVLALAGAALALAAGATALLIALLAGATVVAVAQTARARRQAREAQRQAAHAQAIQRFLQGIFEPLSLAHGEAAARQRLTAADLLGRAASQLVEGRVGGDLSLTAELQGVVGQLLHDLALTERAVALRRLRLASLQRSGAEAIEHAQALADLAASLHQRGDVDEAERCMCAALLLLAGAAGRQAQVRHAVLSVQLAHMRLQRRADDAALTMLQQAVDSLRALAPGGAELADALVVLATALSEHQHQADAAYAVAREALSLLGEGDARRMTAARLRLAIGSLLFAQRRYTEGEAELRQALDSCRHAAGAEHPTTAVIALTLARQLTILGRLDESLPLIRQALPVLEAAGAGIDPAELAEGRMALGEALLEEGRLTEAVPALEAAVAGLRQANATIPQTVAALLLARAWCETGRYGESLVLLHETLDIRMAMWGAEHVSTALVMQRIGFVHLCAGQHDEAEDWLRRVSGADDVREHAFGSVKHRAAATLVHLALERGKAPAALEPAAVLRASVLALPPEQRTRTLRIGTELVWVRVMLDLGRHAEVGPTLAALIALSAPLYQAAPLRVAVCGVHARWLAQQGRSAEARDALLALDAALALQTLAPHLTRLREQAHAALAGPAQSAVDP